MERQRICRERVKKASLTMKWAHTMLQFPNDRADCKCVSVLDCDFRVGELDPPNAA